jgi:hypothetical protein
MYPLVSRNIPYVAAFGYKYGTIIHELCDGNAYLKMYVGLASSLFNMGISLFDYIIEIFDGEEIFKIINHDFLNQLMNFEFPIVSFFNMVFDVINCNPCLFGLLFLLALYVDIYAWTRNYGNN